MSDFEYGEETYAIIGAAMEVYNKASDSTVGLLVNFGATRKLEWKRMVCSRRARSARGAEE